LVFFSAIVENVFMRSTADIPSLALCLTFAGLNDWHVVICGIVSLVPKHAEVLQLLPGAIEVSERDKRLVDGIDECELVETFGLLSACATGVDEAVYYQ
jgi:hypothetical protein